MISLDLDMGDSSYSSNTESEDEITDIEKELTIAKAQLTLMQQLYSELLHRTINRDWQKIFPKNFRKTLDKHD